MGKNELLALAEIEDAIAVQIAEDVGWEYALSSHYIIAQWRRKPMTETPDERALRVVNELWDNPTRRDVFTILAREFAADAAILYSRDKFLVERGYFSDFVDQLSSGSPPMSQYAAERDALKARVAELEKKDD